MNDPSRHAADLQTASIPAEGELRSNTHFHFEPASSNPFKPGLQVVRLHFGSVSGVRCSLLTPRFGRPKTIQNP
jgi:hypothetical protein